MAHGGRLTELPLRKRIRPRQAEAYGRYLTYVREMGETLRAISSMGGHDGLLPIARCFGIAYTDYGLALIVEKITTKDNNLAPTLQSLAESGRFGEREQQLLDAFFEECSKRHIILGDIHSKNIVYTDRERGRFICVDGFGEKAAVPVHLWSKRINARKLQRLRRRLLTEIEGIGPDPLT